MKDVICFSSSDAGTLFSISLPVNNPARYSTSTLINNLQTFSFFCSLTKHTEDGGEVNSSQLGGRGDLRGGFRGDGRRELGTWRS
jgi:hypothetical protein